MEDVQSTMVPKYTARFFIASSCLSFMFFTILTCFISPIISRIFISYGRLSKSKQCDWETRIASNLHAVIVSGISIYCLLFDHETNANPIWNDSFLPRLGVAITLGYIISDFFVIVINYNLIGDDAMLIHHVMAIIAYVFVVGIGLLPFFANFRQLAECSTVFVNQRWYFSVIGEPHSSRSFLINAWSMVISFFLCRIAVIPYYYYKCFIVWDTPGRRLLGVIPQTLWIFTSTVLDVLNVFWMTKMIRGGIKILKAQSKKQ
ncbi:transmembrane protein 56-A [Exaiptasia diaphana]|uniref:TLC domain-containing protein n=1 Tax=Exaiptasia diaphana TaxID=2652724 RepID=A0A913XNN5_EXADI|nr:transmembrane protein 56-A [Exaiptasia diaphana]KXJ10732.1 Transmembrane protein 56-A [Exaiptasia diaphana]